MEDFISKNGHSMNRTGYVLLLMLLLIVVIGGLLWLDPSALFSSSDPNLPWNQEFRLVDDDEQVKAPSEQQPAVSDFLSLEAKVKKDGERRGNIIMMIHPDGRIEGQWAAEYDPLPKVNFLVMSAGFKGNIDASKVFSDENGEDPSKLYFITRGRFLILETNDNTGKVRSVIGRIYVTGWVETEYNVTGELTITSDKKDYKLFSFEGAFVKQMRIMLNPSNLPF
ncbi:hypothetical protein ACFL1G_00600 [Planctomycetota bacterium]